MAQNRSVRRVTPPTRSPDGARPWDKLIDADPGKHYVYVDPSNALMGVEYYESLGYAIEVRREGGVRPAVGKTKGDGDGHIAVLSQILMSIDLAQKEQLDAYGVGGNGGQAFVDQVEKKLVKPGGVDGFRGMGGYLSVLNETEKPRVETQVRG